MMNRSFQLAHRSSPTSYDETYGIPAFADFGVVTYPFVGFTANDGISTSTFLNAFAPFTIHIEYDGAVAERQFSKAEIQRQIDLFIALGSLANIPRVIRKEDAAKPKIKLAPLTNATPVPTVPPLNRLKPDDEFDVSPSTGTVTPRLH
jgi:hypothetical protein